MIATTQNQTSNLRNSVVAASPAVTRAAPARPGTVENQIGQEQGLSSSSLIIGDFLVRALYDYTPQIAGELALVGTLCSP